MSVQFCHGCDQRYDEDFDLECPRCSAPAEVIPEKAPTLLEAARAMLAWATYESEYDGRTYRICHSCDGQDGAHQVGCKVEAYRAAIAAAEGSTPGVVAEGTPSLAGSGSSK